MKKAWIRTLVTGLLCCLLCSCQPTRPTESTDASTGTEEATTPVKEQIKYVYRIAYEDVNFLSEDARESWREPLLKLISNEAVPYHEEGSDCFDWVIPDPSRPGIEYGLSLGLFDFNVDGTPELLVNLGGGSAGNAYYVVYDLLSGREIGALHGGFDRSWCLYLNTATGAYESIGEFCWRLGWQSRTHWINRAFIGDELGGETGVLREDEYLVAEYTLAAIQLPPTEEDLDAERDGGAWDEYCREMSGRVNGAEVSLDEYLAEQEYFMQTYVRLPETGLILVRRAEYDTHEALVEALLSTEQSFLKPEDGEP